MEEESIPPKTRVPEEWVHPMLRQQLLMRGSRPGSAGERIDRLTEQHGALEGAVSRMQQSLRDKRAFFHDLERRVQHVAGEIAAEESRVASAQCVQRLLGEQLILQRTFERQRLFAEAPAEAEAEAEAPGALAVAALDLWGRPPAPDDSDAAARRRLFAAFAPLFAVDAAARLGDAVVFDEPCLLATDAATCGNAACPYWHRDQRAHVSLAARALLRRGAALSAGGAPRCGAAERFHSLRAALSRADLCAALRLLRGAAAECAAAGWAGAMLTGAAGLFGAPRRERDAREASDVCRVAPLLRGAEERVAWDAGRERAAEAFAEAPGPLTWRVLARVLCATGAPEKALWIARRGAALFPASPALRVACVVAHLRAHRPAAECLAVCEEAAAAISAQCAARMIGGAPSARWADIAARHVAYAVARTAVHLCATDAAAAAAQLLAGAAAGRYCLLPVAQQNMALLLAALRADPRGGARFAQTAAALPLAALSDVALALALAGGAAVCPAADELRRLARQAALGAECAAAGIARGDFCSDALRAAAHASLLRAVSSDERAAVSLLAQIPTDSHAVLASAWAAFLRSGPARDSGDALLRALARACPAPLLMLQVSAALARAGADARAAEDAFVRDFAARNAVALDAVADAAGGARSGMPPHVWVPLVVLHARGFAPHARLEALRRIELAFYCESADLFVAVWFDMLRAAVLTAEDETFRECVAHGLLVLREPFLQTFSALDSFFDEMVSFAHAAGLAAYKEMPAMLGASCHRTAHFRQMILDVAGELRVVHPLLFATD